MLKVKVSRKELVDTKVSGYWKSGTSYCATSNENYEIYPKKMKFVFFVNFVIELRKKSRENSKCDLKKQMMVNIEDNQISD